MLIVDVITSSRIVPYPEAVQFMEQKVAEIDAGGKAAIWVLQHSPVYTGGSSYLESDLLDLRGVPFYKTGRGGKVTYHGPGQSVLYAMLPLKKLYAAPDLHQYINDLQDCVINSLKHYNIIGCLKQGRIGVWCNEQGDNGREAKIAAIGVRVRKWITMHGLAVNINPDLSCFSRIIPCGLKNYGVTSCEAQGVLVMVKDFEDTLIAEFMKTMGCKEGNRYEI